jgi:hypothetical protein
MKDMDLKRHVVDFMHAIITSNDQAVPKVQGIIKSWDFAVEHYPEASAIKGRVRFVETYTDAEFFVQVEIRVEDEEAHLELSNGIGSSSFYSSSIPLIAFGKLESIDAKDITEFYKALVFVLYHPHLIPHLRTYERGQFKVSCDLPTFAHIAYMSEFGTTYAGVVVDVIAQLKTLSVNEYWKSVPDMFWFNQELAPARRRDSDEDDCDYVQPRKRR